MHDQQSLRKAKHMQQLQKKTGVCACVNFCVDPCVCACVCVRTCVCMRVPCAALFTTVMTFCIGTSP